VANGIDGSLVGSLTRGDGRSQLTLNGRALYYYAGDRKAGDLNGEGIGEVWHAIAPDGGPAADGSGGADSGNGGGNDGGYGGGPYSSTTSGGGYGG
jgi:hypothetical protein